MASALTISAFVFASVSASVSAIVLLLVLFFAIAARKKRRRTTILRPHGHGQVVGIPGRLTNVSRFKVRRWRASAHTPRQHSTLHPTRVFPTYGECYVRRRPLTLASMKQAKLQLKMALIPNTVVRISRLKSKMALIPNAVFSQDKQTQKQHRTPVRPRGKLRQSMPAFVGSDKRPSETTRCSTGSNITRITHMLSTS